MYVMQTVRHANHVSQTLHEMTAHEFKDAVASAPDHTRYRHWQWQQAHRWVRDGGHHSTPLYTDGDGRIRYARDGH